MIIEVWRKITKVIKANIKIIDIPLLNTRSEDENLLGNLISDLVLQLLSFVAQNERENIKQRQMEGIKIAKEKGVKFGRPRIKFPKEFDDIATLYINKKIPSKKAISNLNISRWPFYRYLKDFKNDFLIKKGVL